MTASELVATFLAYKARLEDSWVPRYVKNPRTGNIFLITDAGSFKEVIRDLGYVPVEVIEEIGASL